MGEGSSMSVLIDKLLDLFFPPKCPFCRAILKDGETLICADCRRSLPWTQGAAREQRFRHIESCVSPLYYEDSVRRSLLRYKFGGVSVYAPKYAELMQDALMKSGVSFDLIAWAPLGPKRLRRRGYDQARLLAECLSSLFEKPCPQLLVKTVENPPQSGTKTAEQRRANVSGVYRVADPMLVKNQRVLLVDDIVTTGATLSECARVLRAAGAKNVSAITLARSRKD